MVNCRESLAPNIEGPSLSSYHELKHPYDLLIKLLYGCGLRVQDLNFDLGVLTVFRGKGNKHRTVPLPQSLYGELQAQLEQVRLLHQQDLARDYHGVFLRDNTANKSNPP